MTCKFYNHPASATNAASLYIDQHYKAYYASIGHNRFDMGLGGLLFDSYEASLVTTYRFMAGDSSTRYIMLFFRSIPCYRHDDHGWYINFREIK